MEKVDQSQNLNFLDVTMINTGTGKYDFKIHRKNAVTNVQIKPHSFANPSLETFSKVCIQSKEVMF